MAVALRLAKAGFWGGDPSRVLRAPVDVVMLTLQYESFRADYERAFYELNKERQG